MRFHAPLVLLLVACVSTAGDAQQTPTFRAGVNIVRLDVSVLDSNRRPVHGLTADDFTVLEEGKRQEVVAFQAFDIPDRVIPATAWMRDVAPDVATNRMFDGRLVVVVINDAAMRGEYWTTATATRVAQTVLDQLGPNDLTSVVYTLNNDKAQGFTADRARLLAAFGDIKRVAPARFGTKGSCGGQGLIVDALLRVTAALQAEPQRRKTILFVSPGFDMRPLNTSPRECADWLKQDLVRDALRGNINIYGIDPGRLLARWQMVGTTAPPVPLIRRLDDEDGLRTLAESTGGRAIINDEKDHPEAEVPQIFEENSSYYMLGFQSENPTKDGKFRRLDVKVDRPGSEVRTRSGYFAEASKPRSSSKPTAPLSPLQVSLTGLLPMTEVPLRAMAAPFALPGKAGTTVVIALGVQQPASDGRTTEHVSVLANAFDLDGKSQAFARQTLDVALEASPNGHVQYEVLSRLDLAPGRYELRVGTLGAAQQRGSVYTFIDVPDFAKESVSLSGLLMERASSTTPAGVEAIAQMVPVVPTVEREFAPADRVTAFLRVYQGGKDHIVPTSMEARIVNDANEIAFAQTTPFGAARFATNRSADYRLDLPLGRLQPGEYLLTVETTVGKSHARRDVRFTVR